MQLREIGLDNYTLFPGFQTISLPSTCTILPPVHSTSARKGLTTVLHRNRVDFEIY